MRDGQVHDAATVHVNTSQTTDDDTGSGPQVGVTMGPRNKIHVTTALPPDYKLNAGVKQDMIMSVWLCYS